MASVEPIVGADWLTGHRTSDPTLHPTAEPNPDPTADANLDPAVVVCDVRSTMSGGDPVADFEAGHLPGAILVVLEDVAAGPPAGTAGRHPLPSPTEFAAALGALGVGNDATVIAYDDRGGALASRLVWMLRIIGERAALLDGGLAAWPHGLAEGPSRREPVTRETVPWPATAVVDASEVADHVAAGGVVVDSRDQARYTGETEPIDAVAGHIPGAINLPFADNLDDRSHFRPAAELAERFRTVAADDQPIVYCGSGVTACHNALAIEHAGLPMPRVYVGSWSGWSHDPERPVATGPTP